MLSTVYEYTGVTSESTTLQSNLHPSSPATPVITFPLHLKYNFSAKTVNDRSPLSL